MAERLDSRDPVSPIGLGIYSLPEAAWLVGASVLTVRRWLMGYRFPVKWKGGVSPPVLSPQLPVVEGHVALGFLDLVELLFIKAFREHGISLPIIRRAAREAARRWKTGHPFCVKRFQTDGHTIFAALAPEEGEEQLIDLPRSQMAFTSVLNPYLTQIEYDQVLGDATMWWPLGRRKHVVVDPRRSFGRPIIVPGGIPTDVIAAAVREDQPEQDVARWYEVPIAAVRAAVGFERSLAA